MHGMSHCHWKHWIGKTGLKRWIIRRLYWIFGQLEVLARRHVPSSSCSQCAWYFCRRWHLWGASNAKVHWSGCELLYVQVGWLIHGLAVQRRCLLRAELCQRNGKLHDGLLVTRLSNKRSWNVLGHWWNLHPIIDKQVELYTAPQNTCVISWTILTCTHRAVTFHSLAWRTLCLAPREEIRGRSLATSGKRWQWTRIHGRN
jgi:hypothetical protein